MHKQDLVINTQAGVTMSSREIAELTGKRHDSVIRTISTLISSAIIQQPQIVEVKNHQGQTVKECVFSGDQGKRDTFVLVARLSPEFTAAIVDRWQELESGFQLPNFSNPAEAARAWADEVEAKQVAIALIEQQKPAVDKAGVAGEHAFNQAKFTAKGVNWIAGLWAQYQLEVAA